MWPDPIVEEIRQVRTEHAARFNFDLQVIYADLRQQKQASQRQVVSLSPKPALVWPQQSSKQTHQPSLAA